MKPSVDPDVRRWKQEYPRFPGVAKCVELLLRPNTQGSWIDIICHELQVNAHDHSDELITATRVELERDSQVSRILLHVLADSRLPAAIDLFAELLRSRDHALHAYGVTGLTQLDTKDARRILYFHGIK